MLLLRECVGDDSQPQPPQLLGYNETESVKAISVFVKVDQL